MSHDMTGETRASALWGRYTQEPTDTCSLEKAFGKGQPRDKIINCMSASQEDGGFPIPDRRDPPQRLDPFAKFCDCEKETTDEILTSEYY
ncbi:hypothetical protein ACRRTK_008419 [Alexandromys fortis]